MASINKGPEYVFDYLKENVSAVFADVFKQVGGSKGAKVGEDKKIGQQQRTTTYLK